MAVKRRKFLKNSLTGIAAISTANWAFTMPTKSISRTGNQPIVISTWDFGIAANQEAWKILSKGGKAIDAVEAGVRVPEADLSNTTVGKGGYPDREGIVTLDACIMDEKGNCGSVAALEHIAHPISVARMVMDKTPHVMLVGEGALQFALENGFKKENLLTKEAEEAWKEWLKEKNIPPSLILKTNRELI